MDGRRGNNGGVRGSHERGRGGRRVQRQTSTASLQVLDIVQDYLDDSGFIRWLRSAVSQLVSGSQLPYNPYSWLLNACVAKACAPDNQDTQSTPLLATANVHADDQLPSNLFAYNGSLDEEAYGLQPVLLLANARIVRTATLVAKAVESTWMACVKSSLPFKALLTLDIPSLWGLSSASTAELNMSCDCLMRGIGAEDGLLVFVSILQKFAAKLNTETHVLLWIDAGDERLEPGEVQTKASAGRIVDALKSNAGVALSAVLVDSNTHRPTAYRLSLGLNIIANQMDEHATLSTRPAYHLVRNGAFLSRAHAAFYMSLFSRDGMLGKHKKMGESSITGGEHERGRKRERDRERQRQRQRDRETETERQKEKGVGCHAVGAVHFQCLCTTLLNRGLPSPDLQPLPSSSLLASLPPPNVHSPVASDLAAEFVASLQHRLTGFEQPPQQYASTVLETMFALAALDDSGTEFTPATATNVTPARTTSDNTDAFESASKPQHLRLLRHLLSSRMLELEGLVVHMQTAHAILNTAPASALPAPAHRHIAAVCDNIAAFFRSVDHPSISAIATDVTRLCEVISSPQRSLADIERLGVYLNFALSITKHSLDEALHLAGVSRFLQWEDALASVEEYMGFLQGFDTSSIAWGLHNDLVLNVDQIAKTSRLPQKLRRSAVVAQYLTDMRMDETLRQVLLEVIGNTSLPANPYTTACFGFRRAMWLAELVGETDAKLIGRITHIDPLPTATDEVASLGQPPLFGTAATLKGISPRKLGQVMEMLQEIKTPPLAGRGEAEAAAAIWLAGDAAFAASHGDTLVAVDCHEHTHVTASRRGRAFEIFVEHLIQSLQTLSGQRPLISGIATPGAAWTIEDVRYNTIEFKSAVQFALQARESLTIRMHIWTGHQFMTLRKHVTLSISSNDGSLLLAPTAPSIGLAVRTAVFPTLQDAACALRFPTLQTTPREQLATQLAEEMTKARADGDAHTIFKSAVKRCALTGDWTLLPPLTRYFSSVVSSLTTCDEVLGTLVSLQMLEMETDEVDGPLRRQRQATCMQARALVTLVLQYHALHLPQGLQSQVAQLLLTSTAGEDSRYARYVQQYLHVLLRGVAQQLYAVFDDVRDLALTQAAALRALGQRDDDHAGVGGGGSRSRGTGGGRGRGEGGDVSKHALGQKTKKTVVLEDNQPTGWSI